MFDGTDLNELADRIGGPFHLSALSQKRLQELLRLGARLPQGNQHLLLRMVFREVEVGVISMKEADVGQKDPTEAGAPE